MKWIKVAIGALIAVSVVPIVVLGFLNTKKSLEKEEIIITFDVSYDMDDGVYYRYMAPDIPTNDMFDYIDNDYDITNLSLLFDTGVVNITITDYYIEELGEVIIIIDNNSLEFQFSIYGLSFTNTYDSIYSVNAENLTSIDIIFSKPSNIKHGNIISMILSFAPIVFIGGVLFYFYNPLKRRD